MAIKSWLFTETLLYPYDFCFIRKIKPGFLTHFRNVPLSPHLSDCRDTGTEGSAAACENQHLSEMFE